MERARFFEEVTKAAGRGVIAGLVLGGVFTFFPPTSDYGIAIEELTVVSYPSESTGPESSKVAVVAALGVEPPRFAFNLQNGLGHRR